jgi:hypothetical protein
MATGKLSQSKRDFTKTAEPLEVEDHPLYYGEFDGTILQGEYGGRSPLSSN